MTKRIKFNPLSATVGAALVWAMGLGLFALGGGATAQVQTAAADGSIGIAATVMNDVTGKRGANMRQIEFKDEIFQTEKIETGAGSAAEIVLRDNTRISLAPRSSILIEKAIFDPSPSRRKVSVMVTSGTIRFISGNSPSSAYEVKTPAGTIGVSGTDFVVLLGFNGSVSVSVNSGSVLLANNAGESVTIEKGQASTIRPVDETGKQAAPSVPTRPSDAIAVSAQRLDTVIAEAKVATNAARAGANDDGAVGGRSGRVLDSEKATTANLESVPAKALQGALNGSDDGVRALIEYLNGAGAKPEDVTRRAVSVLRALQEIPGMKDNYDALVLAADRIAQAASNIFNTGSIMRLTIDKDYKLPDRAVAMDLKPVDGEPAPGWQNSTPRDQRLIGKGMRGIRRPGGEPLTSDGIVGVEGADINVPKDLYRVIVMTDDFGASSIGNDAINFFGDELVVNDTTLKFNKTDPSSWNETAYLTNKPLKLGTAAPDGSSGKGRQSGGGQAGDGGGGGSGDSVSDASTKSAGVVVIETEAVSDKVNMQFVSEAVKGRSPKTYIVALLIEPIEQPSSVKGFPDLARFLELEKQLAKKLAEILSQVEPTAGTVDENLFENDSKSPSPS
ncbi:MAG: FecR domain-containing protein [Alphaproteobacteria bacterium]